MSFFERLRPQLPSLLVEAVSVLLAVLLALAIDEWRESRTNDRLRDEMLQKLALEVGKNRENLDLAMTLQRDELTGIQELRSRIDEGEPLSEARLNVSTELLRDAAWQTALVTGAVQFMDLDQVSELTDAYTVQSMVDDGFRRIVQVLASGELQSKGGHGMALAELDGSCASSSCSKRTWRRCTPPISRRMQPTAPSDSASDLRRLSLAGIGRPLCQSRRESTRTD